MSDDSKLTFDQEIRVHALNLATGLRRADVRFHAGKGPDGLAEVSVRDAAVFADYLAAGEIPATGRRGPDRRRGVRDLAG